MAKKQHRSQENLRNVALANASKPQKGTSKPQKEIEPTIVSISGMDEFSPRIAASKLQDELKGNKVKLALIRSAHIVVSLKKLKTEFGEPQRWRAATASRKAFTGSKRNAIEWIAEAVAMAWQKARGNA